MKLFNVLWLVFISVDGANGFGVQNSQTENRPADASVMTRSNFVAALVGGLALGTCTNSPAWAKDVDPALKGTKKDPAFEACLSQCMYDCTKPKGAEQKSRAECLPECKQQCATNKNQLLRGEPKAE